MATGLILRARPRNGRKRCAKQTLTEMVRVTNLHTFCTEPPLTGYVVAGQTNGLELGDPCCTWTEGKAADFLNDITHPCDANKLTSRQCSAVPACANGVNPCVSVPLSVDNSKLCVQAAPSPGSSATPPPPAFVGPAAGGALAGVALLAIAFAAFRRRPVPADEAPEYEPLAVSVRE